MKQGLLISNVVLIIVVLLALFRISSFENALGLMLKEEVIASRNHYFATTEDGRLIPLRDLGQADLDEEDIKQIVVSALNSTFSFNARDYKNKLGAASRLYTKRGWESFTNLLNKDLMFQADRDGLFFSLILQDTPEILERELKSGRLEWQVKANIVLVTDKFKREYEVFITLVRSPRLESPNGVAVEQVVFKAKSDGAAHE